jgi:hypothetical protein
MTAASLAETPTSPIDLARLAPLYAMSGREQPHRVDQEDSWGCLRGAVASIPGLDYEQTPSLIRIPANGKAAALGGVGGRTIQPLS